jgi:methionyl-tRNA formyltransferase
MKGIHFFLNGERGIGVVRELVAHGHGIESLIVPDGKGEGEISTLAKEIGASFRQRTKVNDADFIAWLAASSPEIFIIGGFPIIFRQNLLALPRLGTINLHGGRLPEYRGGSPLNWQMINGEAEAGISVIQVDEGIDSGDILAEASFAIADQDDIADLHRKANGIFPGLTLEVLRAIELGSLKPRAQDKSRAAYWHQRNDDDGHLSPLAMTASEAHRFIRAITTPYPGAFARLGEKRVRLLTASRPEVSRSGTPGRVFYHLGQGPFLVFKDRCSLRLESYRFEDDLTRKLNPGDFLE